MSEGENRLDTVRLQEMVQGFWRSGALMAAVELGLFTAISKGAGSYAEAAEALDITEVNAERLITVCVALELIEQGDDGRLTNAPDVERFPNLIYFPEPFIVQPLKPLRALFSTSRYDRPQTLDGYRRWIRGLQYRRHAKLRRTECSRARLATGRRGHQGVHCREWRVRPGRCTGVRLYGRSVPDGL